MPETNAGSENRPLIVLIHGAWHGAWCWAALQHELDNRGIASLAIDLPGHGVSTLPFSDLHGDAQHVVDVVGQLGRRVVLVGHSYGGAVVTEAAHRLFNAGANVVSHLVYLAAFCLEAGESVMDLARHESGGPVDLGAAMIPIDGGLSSLDPDKAAPALYGDCDELAVSAALERLCPQPIATMVQAVGGSPWRTAPSTYVVCTRDRSVHPGHQEYMATRCTNVVRLETDHSPFMSMTTETADILEGALR
jgi:pimeloyl-ACP methyl ester carboxylesterase